MSVVLMTSAASWAGAAQIEDTPDTLVFSVNGGARYEDNRDATESNKEAMTTLSFTPGVRLNVDDPITRAFLSYRPTLLWRDNPRYDQNDTELYHAAEANVRHKASSRLLLGALDKFEMTDDPNVTQGGTKVRENASYWVNQTKAWFIFDISDRTAWTMDGSYLIKRYKDKPYSEQGDEDRLQSYTSLRYQLEPDYHAFVFAEYDQPTFDKDVRGDYKGYSGGVGLDRTFNDQLKGSVSVGYEYLDYQTAAAETDATEPFFRLSAEFKPYSDLVIVGDAEYSLQPSDRSLYSSKQDLRLALKGIWRLGESFSTDAQVVYDNGAYKANTVILENPDDVDQVVVNGDDTLVDYQIGLTYKPLGSQYSGRLAYEYEDWTSDVRESFTRNTVSAQVALDF
jgi:hypothetical protein